LAEFVNAARRFVERAALAGELLFEPLGVRVALVELPLEEAYALP